MGLELVAPRIAYFTGNQELNAAGLDGFYVHECLPFDVKRVTAALRIRSVGTVEVKKRGVDIDPAALQKRWSGRGDESLAVLIFPHGGQTMAVLAERTVD